jgi:hypothetical protein
MKRAHVKPVALGNTLNVSHGPARPGHCQFEFQGTARSKSPPPPANIQCVQQ